MARSTAKPIRRLPPSIAPTLTVDVVVADHTRATLRVRGELDLVSADVLANALDAHLAYGRRFVRLDVSGLDFCDAAGLDVLEEFHHRFARRRGSIVLAGLSSWFEMLLRITALDELLLTSASPRDVRPPARRSRSQRRPANAQVLRIV